MSDIIQRIKADIDIADYMTSRGYTLKAVGSELYCAEISGFCLNPNTKKFYDHKNEVGGSIIDLVMYLDNVNLTEAISSLRSELRDEASRHKPREAIAPLEEKVKNLELPKMAEGKHSRVFAYLTKKRAISNTIVSEMMKRRLVYQEGKYGNCVFVGYDYDNTAKFACLRSTGDTRFAVDVTGSSKKIGWFVGNQGSTNLMACESAIDAMSLMTMLGKDWTKYSYLSQGGAGSINTLKYHLVKNPQINKLYLCYDNDYAGQKAVIRAVEMLKEIGFKGQVIKKMPKSKDFNEDLQIKSKEFNTKMEEPQWER